MILRRHSRWPGTRSLTPALLPVLVLVLQVQVAAMTWSFDQDGDVQGWRAQEGVRKGATSSTARLQPVTCADGILRARVPAFRRRSDGNPIVPSLDLVSPPIGYDAALFDRLLVRFRVVHANPIAAQAYLWWTDEDTRDQRPGQGGFVYRMATYTTDWQELSFTDLDLVPATSCDSGACAPLVLHLEFILATGSGIGPEDVPEAVELDWVTLTGVEEQLHGELPPPASSESACFGDLFASARFSPLRRGVGGVFTNVPRAGAVGDVDGDGDADLATLWTGDPWGEGDGWLIATNDGHGVFSLVHSERIGDSGGTPTPLIDGADLDGDGGLDLLIGRGADAEIQRSEGESGLRSAEAFGGGNRWPLGLGDADGDGRADLWMRSWDADPVSGAAWHSVIVHRSLGATFSADPRVIRLAESKGTYAPIRLVGGLPGGVTGALWWRRGHGLELTYLDPVGDLVEAHLAVTDDQNDIRWAGDCDRDGDVDLVVGTSSEFDHVLLYTDLVLRLNRGDGTFDDLPWHPGARLHQFLHAADLDGDGTSDLAFVDSDWYGPTVIVDLGVIGGVPVPEGRYPLSGVGGLVLTGDVDNDGDVDLLVTERAAAENGGVHVLLSRLAEGNTAVGQAGASAQPRTFALLPAYPNPFNPEVTIPFTLAADVPRARLTVYNVLGQPVRTLVDGALAPGEHRVVWDGRDARGQPLPSGVYFHRLEGGGQTATGRCLRVE